MGHFGREAGFNDVFSRDYGWSGMRTDMEHTLESGDVCLRLMSVSAATILQRSIAISTKGPCDHYHLSVRLPESVDGYKAALHTINVLTGFVILRRSIA